MSAPPDPAIDAAPEGAAPLLFRDAQLVNQALGESLKRWDRIAVNGHWLVNSHPKSGTHLLRNILLHFNSAAVYEEFLFYDTVSKAVEAAPAFRVFVGHLPYAPVAATTADGAAMQSILLLRHPGAIALALARAFYDVNSTRPDHLELRERDSFEEIVRKVVCGYECAGMKFGPLAGSLSEFCLDWLGKARFTVKFEDLLAALAADDRALLAHLQPILEAVFATVPSDAVARIRAGAATAISATYSRTREGAYDALKPNDVSKLLPPEEAGRIRDIAAMLRY